MFSTFIYQIFNKWNGGKGQLVPSALFSIEGIYSRIAKCHERTERCSCKFSRLGYIVVSEHMLFSPKKNPAYGRQRISQPMRIVAPIPKNSATKATFAQFVTLYEQKLSILRPLLSITFPQGFQKENNGTVCREQRV